MKIAVIHYSLTGHSTTVAQAIADELGVEVHRINDVKPRKGTFGVLRSVVQTLLGMKVRLKQPEIDVSDYDLLIIGGPIWVGQICAPLKTYLSGLEGRDVSLAWFNVHRDTYSEEVRNQIHRLTGQIPVAIADFVESDVENGIDSDIIRAFIEQAAGRDWQAQRG